MSGRGIFRAMRGLPGSDAWLSPPDEKVPPSGDDVIYVERLAADESEWVEYEITVTYDEGSIFSATLDGKPFTLTADEIKRAEEDWAMDAAENPPERDEPEWDADR